MNGAEYLTVTDVADRLGLNTEQVNRRIASGKLRAVNLAGRRSGHRCWRITKASIEDFIAGLEWSAEPTESPGAAKWRSIQVSGFPKMFTPPEVAKLFGVQPQKVLTWIATGDLRH